MNFCFDEASTPLWRDALRSVAVRVSWSNCTTFSISLSPKRPSTERMDFRTLTSSPARPLRSYSSMITPSCTVTRWVVVLSCSCLSSCWSRRSAVSFSTSARAPDKPIAKTATSELSNFVIFITPSGLTDGQPITNQK